MATPIVSFGTVATGFPTSVNITGQDVGTGSNRVAVVAIGATSTLPNPLSVSVGTDSLTAQGTVFTDSNGWKFRLYAGVLTVTGSQTVNATWDDDANAKLIVGCVLPSSALPIGDLTTGSALTSSSQPTWTIDSATGDTVVALMFLESAATFTATSPAALLTGTGLGGTVIPHGMYEAGATSVVIDGSVGGATNFWRGFGFNVPAAGGGSFTITADQGTHTVTGQTANLLTTRLITGDFATYTLTGQDATLTKATPGAFSINAEFGTYSISGTEAYAQYAMNAEYGVYALNGQDATFTLGVPMSYTIAADGGIYLLSGRSANLLWSGAPQSSNVQTKISISMRIGF